MKRKLARLTEGKYAESNRDRDEIVVTRLMENTCTEFSMHGLQYRKTIDEQIDLYKIEPIPFNQILKKIRF